MKPESMTLPDRARLLRPVLAVALALCAACGAGGETTFVATRAFETLVPDEEAGLSFSIKVPRGGTLTIENLSEFDLAGELSWEPVDLSSVTEVIHSESFVVDPGTWTREIPATLAGRVTLRCEQGARPRVEVSISQQSLERIPEGEGPELRLLPTTN